MELVVQVAAGEALEAALKLRVGGVALRVPPRADDSWWAETGSWRAAARQYGSNFYLIWDWLVQESERPLALEVLTREANLAPEGLSLLDVGVAREARRRHGGLRLQAAWNWGCHNVPGLKAARRLGFGRVTLEGPLGLKDLALMRRESSMPMEMTIPALFPGYPGVSLPETFGGLHRLDRSIQEISPGAWLQALERLPGLMQLGLEGVALGPAFSTGETLHRVVPLFQEVLDATPKARAKVLAAAREVFLAFGEAFRGAAPLGENIEDAGPVPTPGVSFQEPSHLPGDRPGVRGGSRGLWLETRGYAEAVALAHLWREPLVLTLSKETFQAFTKEYRRWQGRHLIWRLPLIPQEAVPFYQKALAVLRDGGYSRLFAPDWGGVELIRQASGRALGDETLGICNTWAFEAARELGVQKVCLPPGETPAACRSFLEAAGPEAFWAYLYHCPTLAVCPRQPEEESPAIFRESPKDQVRWVAEEDLTVLTTMQPINLSPWRDWLLQRRVSPLVLALPRSGLPWGRVPSWAPATRPPGPRREKRTGEKAAGPAFPKSSVRSRE